MTITITWATIKTVALYLGLVALGVVLAFLFIAYSLRNLNIFR